MCKLHRDVEKYQTFHQIACLSGASGMLFGLPVIA
jgi:hypothetical protein